jgi:hypothetical protein
VVNRINLITDSRIKREKESTFRVIAKFDPSNQFLRRFGTTVGGTPNRCTYSVHLSAF